MLSKAKYPFLIICIIVSTFLLIPSAWSASCYGSSCDGQDPNRMGCGGDAYSKRLIYISGHRVELRHSRKCNALWARVKTSSTGWSQHWIQLFGFTSKSSTSNSGIKNGKHVRLYSKQAPTKGTYWTEMIPYSMWGRACYSDKWSTALPTAPWRDCTTAG